MLNRSLFRKLIRFALAFVVAISIIAITPLKSVMITTRAADSGSIGDISWQRVGNTLKIGPTNGVSGTLERWDDAIPYPWYMDNSFANVEIYGSITLGENSSELFCGLSGVDRINYLNKLDTSKVTDMSGMFKLCYRLYTVNLTHFDTSNVTDMSYMFYGCNRLSNVDLRFFDTSNVTDMSYMFTFCNSLLTLDLSRFNTANVTDMECMFSNCSSLTNLYLSRDFNTGRTENFGAMFYNCQYLENLNLSAFDTSSAVRMYGMFSKCSSLKSIDLSSFDTSGVQSMGAMFEGCTSLESLNISSFDTRHVEDMNNMFNGDANLKSIYVSQRWNTGSVSSSEDMFADCSVLPNFDVNITDKTNAHYRTGGYLKYKYHDFGDPDEVPYTPFNLKADSETVPLDETVRITGTYTGDTPENLTVECSDPDALEVESFTYNPETGIFEMTGRMVKPGQFEISIANGNLVETVDVTVTGRLVFLQENYKFLNADAITLEAKYNGLHKEGFKASADPSGAFSDITCNITETGEENTYLVTVTAKTLGKGSYRFTLTNGTESAEVSVELEHEGFSAQHDGWPLINIAGTFGYGEYYDYFLSNYLQLGESFEQFDSSFLEMTRLFYRRAWDGNSFGLSLLAAAQYAGKIDISEYTGKKTGYLNTSGYNDYQIIRENNRTLGWAYIVNNPDLIALIERAECSIFSTEIRSSRAFDSDSTYHQLIDHLSADKASPIVACMKTSHGWHAVVLETYQKPEKTEEGVYKILLYDSNAPDLLDDLQVSQCPHYDREKPYILLNTVTGGYEYYYNGALDYASDYYDPQHVQNIVFYDVRKLDPSIFEGKNSIDHSRTTDFMISDSVRISDESGKTLFEIADGEARVYSESVEYIPYLGTSKQENMLSGMVSLPKGSYVYTSSGYLEVISLSDEFKTAFKVDGVSSVTVNQTNAEIIARSESDTAFKAGVLCKAEGEDALAACEGTLRQNEFCSIDMDENGIATFFSNNTLVEPVYEVDGTEYTVYYARPEWEWNEDLTEAYAIFYDSLSIRRKFAAKLTVEGRQVTASVYFDRHTWTDVMYKESGGGEEPGEPDDPEPLTLDYDSISIVVGSSKQLTASVQPVTWRTLNEVIAGIEQNGLVKGRRPGKTYIEASSSDGQIAKCFVNVLFTDVAESSLYYFEPVYWALDRGITNGYTDADGMIRTFKPQNNCTREAVVTFLWRLAGRPEPFNLNSPFSDVQDRNKYYYKAVLWAAEQGITKGYADGSFRPNATCLREHVVTFLWRYANQPAPKTSRNPFNDVSASDYYYKAALWANEKGIAKGYSSGPHAGGFGPKLDCLREHVVTFLYRYATK